MSRGKYDDLMSLYACLPSSLSFLAQKGETRQNWGGKEWNQIIRSTHSSLIFLLSCEISRRDNPAWKITFIHNTSRGRERNHAYVCHLIPLSLLPDLLFNPFCTSTAGEKVFHHDDTFTHVKVHDDHLRKHFPPLSCTLYPSWTWPRNLLLLFSSHCYPLLLQTETNTQNVAKCTHASPRSLVVMMSSSVRFPGRRRSWRGSTLIKKSPAVVHSLIESGSSLLHTVFTSK